MYGIRVCMCMYCRCIFTIIYCPLEWNGNTKWIVNTYTTKHYYTHTCGINVQFVFFCFHSSTVEYFEYFFFVFFMWMQVLHWKFYGIFFSFSSFPFSSTFLLLLVYSFRRFEYNPLGLLQWFYFSSIPFIIRRLLIAWDKRKKKKTFRQR